MTAFGGGHAPFCGVLLASQRRPFGGDRYRSDREQPGAVLRSFAVEVDRDVDLHIRPLRSLLVLQELESYQAAGEDGHSAVLASRFRPLLLLSMFFSNTRARRIAWPAPISSCGSFGDRLDHYIIPVEAPLS